MTDFASAAMVRVLVNGMQSLGLDTSAADMQPTQGDAQVRLDIKQQLVGSAVRQAGLSCLVKLGRGGHLNLDDPTHRALTLARDAADLFDRWGRLERFVHSLHWVEVAALEPGAALLIHRSRAPGAAPSAAEDLVVLGVLLALLEAIGLQDVAAEIDGRRVYPEAGKSAEAVLQRLAQGARTGTWHVRWRPPAHAQARSVAPARPGPAQVHAPRDLCSALPWPKLAHHCAAIILDDLLQRRTVGAVARDVGTSARSLQRALAAAGLSYSSVLAEARLRAGAWWLLESTLPIAEVGFLSGYADQPHFTRDFSRRIGLSPGRYRENFVRGA
ncbi:MAG: helix-turn-helix transcriptional regulator [Polaromonas sp.]|uniref:helix-turn-helix transcriptional regulator n=1 Tax=Polaromonas sp. TaxID=1869339 RepID=UPI002736301E|nr:helix-turn-helix transcriptional regulator [Polaromonas sp.]MDP2817397.1 helix-turn-helix transcriptional regulator [Polaromonas sp.]